MVKPLPEPLPGTRVNAQRRTMQTIEQLEDKNTVNPQTHEPVIPQKGEAVQHACEVGRVNRRDG